MIAWVLAGISLVNTLAFGYGVVRDLPEIKGGGAGTED